MDSDMYACLSVLIIVLIIVQKECTLGTYLY